MLSLIVSQHSDFQAKSPGGAKSFYKYFEREMKRIFYKNGKLKNATPAQDVVGGKTHFEALKKCDSLT